MHLVESNRIYMNDGNSKIDFSFGSFCLIERHELSVSAPMFKDSFFIVPCDISENSNFVFANTNLVFLFDLLIWIFYVNAFNHYKA